MKLMPDEKIDFSTLCIASVLVNKNEIIFFENLRKALCRANLKTGEVQIERSLKSNTDINIGKIVWYKNKIYLFSQIGFYVYIYNAGEQKEYKICANIKEYDNDKNVSLYKRINNKVFILPVELVCQDGILIGIVFDLDKEEYSSVLFSPIGNILKGKVCCLDYPSSNGGIVSASIIYTNICMNINLVSKQYELNYLNMENVHLSSISKDESGVWMTQQDNSSIIHVKDFENGNIHVLSVGKIIREQPYSHIYCLKNYIIVLPRSCDKAVLIEKKSDRIYIFDINCGIENRKFPGASRCISCVEINNKIYLFPYNMQAGIIINIETMESSLLNLWCEKEHFFAMLHQSLYLCKEIKNLNLYRFIEFIRIYNEDNTRMLRQKRRSIGVIILREV